MNFPCGEITDAVDRLREQSASETTDEASPARSKALV